MMPFFLRLVAVFTCLGISAAAAAPQFPPDYDVGDNSVRGGEIGERVTLQLTPYNAGEKLFENDRFTVYERINALSSNVTTYGDPICAIQKPGEEYEGFGSAVVVVMNLARDEPITRRMLWDEVRPVLSRIVHDEGRCPRAHGINAHVFIKGWDVAGNGEAYIPELFQLPRIQLEPVTQQDVALGFNHRNTRAFDAINAVVSEGIMSAYFAFARGKHPNCDKPSGWQGIGCVFETFAPVYWGAPERLEYFSRMDRSITAGRGKTREALRRQAEAIGKEYEARYATFDGHLDGIRQRIKRDEYVRLQKALRHKVVQRYYEIMRQVNALIEEKGMAPFLIAALGSAGSGSTGGICGVRSGSLMNRCTEDFLLLVY